MLLKPPTTSNVSSTSTPKNTGTSPSRFYNKTTQRVDEYGRLVKVRVAHAPNMVRNFFPQVPLMALFEVKHI